MQHDRGATRPEGVSEDRMEAGPTGYRLEVTSERDE